MLIIITGTPPAGLPQLAWYDDYYYGLNHNNNNNNNNNDNDNDNNNNNNAIMVIITNNSSMENADDNVDSLDNLESPS